MGRMSRLGNELYTGRRSVDFVGRRWLWYAISGVIILVALLGLTVRGLNYSIEFTGGAQYQVTLPAAQATQDEADSLRTAVADTGIEAAAQPVVTRAGSRSILVQTEHLTDAQSQTIAQTILTTTGADASELSQSEIGASWGSDVSHSAIQGLVVFLILVVLFIWAYFREWKMSVAAIVALAHDVLITVGVYALSGFEVSPATVTGVLTILGFSLYDTVVVFDKIRENTKNLRSSRMTYAQAANLAVNQTLVRSVNTSLVALIPVAAILYVGAVQLGASTLKDLALALFVGMIAGAYSSIFIASPLLVHIKRNEAAVKDAERRAKTRQRREADRYAAVPSFTEDMAVADDPDAVPTRGRVAVAERDADEADQAEDDEYEEYDDEPGPRPGADPEAMGRGRVVPTSPRPVTRSPSSGRQQPSRQTRARRGKK